MPTSYMQENDIIGGGGWGGIGAGGGWGFIILIFLFFSLFAGGGLFGRRDGHDDGCNVRGCRPTFYDESNYQEERNLDNKICMEGDKTRALIVHESERASDRAWYKDQVALSEAKAENAGLKNVIYTNGEFQKVYTELGQIKCRQPELRPVYANTISGCAVEIPSCFPRREHGCDFI